MWTDRDQLPRMWQTFFSWKKNQWFKSHSWIFIKISTKSVSWLGSDQYIFFLWFFQNIMFLYLQMRKGKEICPGWLWNIYQQRNIYMLGSTSKRDWSRMDMENTIINLSLWRKGKALTIKKDTKELWWQKHCIRIRILVISISNRDYSSPMCNKKKRWAKRGCGFMDFCVYKSPLRQSNALPTSSIN